MGTTRSAIVLGVLMMLPASGVARSSAGTLPARNRLPGQAFQTSRAGAQSAKATMHATKGVVTFVDANTLVITRSKRHWKETSFVLNSSTERVGTVKVGSTVDVRYRSEADHKIATAVTVERSG